MTKDSVDFVRQGAFVALGMILVEQSEASSPSLSSTRSAPNRSITPSVIATLHTFHLFIVLLPFAFLTANHVPRSFCPFSRVASFIFYVGGDGGGPCVTTCVCKLGGEGTGGACAEAAAHEGV